MKIVRRGNLKERKWRGDCRSCGAEIEAVESEVNNVTHYRDGKFGSVKCPQCNASLHVYPVTEK